MVQSVPTKAVLHPAKAAAMCTCDDYARPLPSIPPFLLVENLSSKRIVPTDNMQPKSDNPKRRHCKCIYVCTKRPQTTLVPRSCCLKMRPATILLHQWYVLCHTCNRIAWGGRLLRNGLYIPEGDLQCPFTLWQGSTLVSYIIEFVLCEESSYWGCITPDVLMPTGHIQLWLYWPSISSE